MAEFNHNASVEYPVVAEGILVTGTAEPHPDALRSDEREIKSRGLNP